MADYTSDYSSYAASATSPPLSSPESISLSPAMSNGTSTSFLPSSSSAAVYPSSLLPTSSSASSAALLPNDFDPGAASDEFLALSPEEDDAQLRAISTWTKRVQLCFAAHLVSAMALLRTEFWISSIVGLLLLLAFYLFAHFMKIRRKNFIYLFMLVVSLNLVRDGVVLFFYFQALDKDWWGLLTLALLGIDAIIVTPCTCYCCFWLHRSTAVSHLSV